MTLALRYAARSHTGLLREGNEDSAYAGPRLLAVADGMGGHAAGEVASAVAIAALAQLDEDAPGNDLLDTLRRSAESANDHVRDMVAGDQALEGMGTTLTALLSAGNRLGLLHVGDSRAYLLRDGELSQITQDHTLVQTLVDEGRISKEEAGSHPQRNLITRVLDGRVGLEFDLSVREVRAGDRYLLCSDGLTGPVGRHETLLEALRLPEPQEAADRLVTLALRGGGPDNVTVIVADVVDAEQPHPLAPVVGGAAAEGPQAPPSGVGDSAAGRAFAAERPAGEPDEAAADRQGEPPRRPARARRRTATLMLLVLILLVLAAGGTWAYVRSQYYVGLEGRQVAIFRGVTGSVAGIELSSVERMTDLSQDRLSGLDTPRVQRGIVARDRKDADQIVQRLQSQAGQDCPSAAAVPPGPVASATPKVTPPVTAGAGAAPTLSTGPVPVPSGCAVAGVGR